MSYVHFYYKQDILFGEYLVSHINIDIAKSVVQERLDFMEHTPTLAVVVAEKVVSIDKEARDYLVSEIGTKYIKAGAVLINSPLKKMFSNLFISISKPKIKTKVFTNEESAVKWLNQNK